MLKNEKLLVDYKCFECGFYDYVPMKRKIVCPECGNENDCWIEGEEPPEKHRDVYRRRF